MTVSYGLHQISIESFGLNLNDALGIEMKALNTKIQVFMLKKHCTNMVI